MRSIRNLLWGLVFITLGVLFSLVSFDVIEFDIFFDGWWTLFIIVPCFIDLFKEENKTGNIIGLVIGILLLLGIQGILSFELLWKLFFPSIFIIIGLSFIFKDLLYSKLNKEIKKFKNEKKKENEFCSTFGSQDVHYDQEVFSGCTLNAVFGSVQCDLRNAIISENAVIESTAIFGSITVFVPENVQVKIKSTPIFGGIQNKMKKEHRDTEKILYIDALCIFGGVEIR